ncbi:winged helix family two component transcriptional regulator [Roseimicrobium gellanilyticum]|uniref:Winged helix family two component transcriptional regulator n=1 Tax=Roseimicrobium gellanilyticum TaxID=748857 RepID=A0A366HW81_9BACT|nr:response regulator transcription factor [Roseimicrobium gellanilyticum]RBP48170.1 winged helix family two component transcriptional regulator [Roseimicrobium gellanilyticum]
MRVLIIEDDPVLQRSLAATLREEDYAVDVASDGVEGLSKAEDGVYDAVLLDVMIPKLDGWAVLERLRARRNTPVLMLTARDAVRDRVKGLDSGADDYLTKPFEIEELLARLRSLIRRAAGHSNAVLEIGPLTIDTTSREVEISGKKIGLTAREYTLLEYLALHRGVVVSRTSLYEHLFDEEDSTLSNLLDVHVSNLRRKLGHEVITTRRGHGYCIP